jgi:RNA polymerase sigma-70 factor (ECF subfamily)
MEPTTPVSLLDRLRRQPGDAADWARLVSLYTPLLYHWARRTGLRPADAEDLVQDVFTALVRKLPECRYDPQRSFHRWLKTVLLNQWRDQIKRRPVPRPAGDDPRLTEQSAADGLDGWIEQEHRAYLARRALELMRRDFQPATWKAVWAVVVEGRPAAEAAAEQGLTANALYVARFRVLARLRQEFDGLLD